MIIKNIHIYFAKFKENNIFQLITLSLFLTALRPIISGSYYYDFLFWNITLAILPNFTVWVYKNYKIKTKWFLLIWLGFFPNSIYLLTDFIHINILENRGINYWYDLMLMTIVSISGFMLAFSSLKEVYQILFGKKIALFKIYVLWLITCFGVYLGREVRLNTWDLINIGNFYNLISNFSFDFDNFWAFILIWPFCLTILFNIWYKKINI